MLNLGPLEITMLVVINRNKRMSWDAMVNRGNDTLMVSKSVNNLINKELISDYMDIDDKHPWHVREYYQLTDLGIKALDFFREYYSDE